MIPNVPAGFGDWQIIFKLIGRNGEAASPEFNHSGTNNEIGHMLFVINTNRSDQENYEYNHKLLWLYEHPNQPYPGLH